MWFFYIARCNDNTLYTGITTDTTRRIREHNGEIASGAKYTLGKRPIVLVYSEKADSRATALKREWAIKQLSRSQKEDLIRSNV